jgi:hypothetical protein
MEKASGAKGNGGKPGRDAFAMMMRAPQQSRKRPAADRPPAPQAGQLQSVTAARAEMSAMGFDAAIIEAALRMHATAARVDLAHAVASCMSLSSRAGGKVPDTDVPADVLAPSEGPAKKVARRAADCEAGRQAAAPLPMHCKTSETNHELDLEPVPSAAGDDQPLRQKNPTGAGEGGVDMRRNLG